MCSWTWTTSCIGSQAGHLTAAPDSSDKTTPLTADGHKSDVRCFFGLTDSVRLGCTHLLTIGEQAPCGLATSLCAFRSPATQFGSMVPALRQVAVAVVTMPVDFSCDRHKGLPPSSAAIWRMEQPNPKGSATVAARAATDTDTAPGTDPFVHSAESAAGAVPEDLFASVDSHRAACTLPCSSALAHQLPLPRPGRMVESSYTCRHEHGRADAAEGSQEPLV
jgi:hypothetical protein